MSSTKTLSAFFLGAAASAAMAYVAVTVNQFDTSIEKDLAAHNAQKDVETVDTNSTEDKSDELERTVDPIRDLPGKNEEELSRLGRAMHRPAFKSLESAAHILRFARRQNHDPETQKRMESEHTDQFFNLLDKVQNSSVTKDGFEETHVLVVEGLRCSGKSTLLSNFEEKGDVAALDLPIMHYPSEVYEAEDVFRSQPLVVRSAFAFVKLYIMAYQIQISSMNTVLVEGYYHSALAHSLVLRGYTDVGALEKDHKEGSLFDWPVDLPEPAMVPFLSASTETRQHRYEERDGAAVHTTDREAAQQQARTDFALNHVISLVKGPELVALDAEADSDAVCETAFQCVEEYGMPLHAMCDDESDDDEDEVVPNLGQLGRGRRSTRISLGVYGAFNEVVPHPDTKYYNKTHTVQW